MARTRKGTPLTLTRRPSYAVTPVAGHDDEGQDWLGIDTAVVGITLTCAGCRETFRYGYAPMQWPIKRAFCVKCVALKDADTSVAALKADSRDSGR